MCNSSSSLKMLSWENDKFLEKCFELSALCFPLWLGTWNFHPALTIPFLMSKLWLWYWLVIAIMVRASPGAVLCPPCVLPGVRAVPHWTWNIGTHAACYDGDCVLPGALPPVPTRHKYRYSGHCFSLYISTWSLYEVNRYLSMPLYISLHLCISLYLSISLHIYLFL